ncbi:MAG: hypothetical protein LLF83_02340 [Methanobacterium sp.]|nr:hypothetical protein [Methanobacterium sp.]
MIDNFNIPPFLRQIIIITIILVAAVALKFTASITSLVLLSMFLSLLLYPFLRWLEKKGLSYNLSIILTLFGIFSLGMGILVFLVVTLEQLIKELPTFSITSSSFMAQYGNQIIQLILSNINLSDISGIIEAGIFIVFSVIFLVYELPQIKKRLIKELGADNPSLKRNFALVHDFIKYFIIRIKVNFFME